MTSGPGQRRPDESMTLLTSMLERPLDAGYQEAADRSLQLWALPPGAAPRSLGVLTPERLLQLAASENAVREVPALAISLEPLGGVPSERGPTGPVLFHGPLIQKQI